MAKYSIIIPVYNVENYLEKCIDSVIEQTYDDFEIIIVNDGSTDSSGIIASKYASKFDFIKLINQENKGLSAARNIGIKSVTTPYFLLLDSDDYINNTLLEKLDIIVSKSHPDIVRFQVRNIKPTGSIDYHEKEFFDFNGVSAFEEIVNFHYVENACIYLYRTDYFKENGFRYPEGAYHEDYALTPLVIYKAKSVSSIDYIGYNYVVRENSIMNSNDYKKTIKKVHDFYNNYINLIKEIDAIVGIEDKRIIKSFLANSLILKVTELKGKDYRHYIGLLKQEKVYDNILANTLTRKIKKMIIKISPKLYYKRR